MRINWKKIMAGTLSVCMLASCAPGISEFGDFSQAIESVQAATETTYSGTCGAKAKWKYNAKTKTLTISGTGEMGNCTARQDASYEIIPPWEEREVKGWKVEKVAVHGNRHGGLIVGQEPKPCLLRLDGIVVAFWEHRHTFFR